MRGWNAKKIFCFARHEYGLSWRHFFIARVLFFSVDSMSGFEKLGINRILTKNLKEVFGYDEPQKVQKLSIPASLESDKDMVVKSSTGSGKTLGFLVPVAHDMLKSSATGQVAVVLSPAKELAAQTLKEAGKLLQNTSIGCALVIGGDSKSKQIKAVEKSRLVVATPGRLLDLLQTEKSVKDKLVGKVGWIVLDECDNLLNMGFKRDIDKIMKLLQGDGEKKMRKYLFTATIPESVADVIHKYLEDDHIKLESMTDQKPKITQKSLVVKASCVITALWQVLHAEQEKTAGKIMVFFSARNLVAVLSGVFRKGGFPVYEIHSGLSSGQRLKAAQKFGADPKGVMFCTDAVGRGIDFPDVKLVVQVGVVDLAQYEHRIGRTGRAGRSGEALLIIAQQELPLLVELKKKHDIADYPVELSCSRRPAKLKEAVDKMSAAEIKERDMALASLLGSLNEKKGMFKWRPVDILLLGLGIFKPLGYGNKINVSEKLLKKMGLITKTPVQDLQVVE